MPITPTTDEHGHFVYTGTFSDSPDAQTIRCWLYHTPTIIDTSKYNTERLEMLKTWLKTNNIDESVALVLDTEEMEPERMLFLDYIASLSS